MMLTTDGEAARNGPEGSFVRTPSPSVGGGTHRRGSIGALGVQGRSPGTRFLPSAKKQSVFCFFCPLPLVLGEQL